MERTTSQLSEKELAQEIIRLHDTGLGCRRISRKLEAMGIRANKDKVNRMFSKYKRSDTEIEDEELRLLRQSETEIREHIRLEREKEEVRKRLADLFVEEATMTFAQRKKLFEDQNCLLKFGQRTVAVTDPGLWTAFLDYCLDEEDLAEGLSEALGHQKSFEALSAQNPEAKMRLDSYLRERMRQCIASWETVDEEECEKEETEPKATAAKKEGCVTIIFPAPDPL